MLCKLFVAINLLFLFIKDRASLRDPRDPFKNQTGWFLKFHSWQFGFWSPASPPFESTQK